MADPSIHREACVIQPARLAMPLQILDSADSDSWTATLQWHSQAKAEASDLVRASGPGTEVLLSYPHNDVLRPYMPSAPFEVSHRMLLHHAGFATRTDHVLRLVGCRLTPQPSANLAVLGFEAMLHRGAYRTGRCP